MEHRDVFIIETIIDFCDRNIVAHEYGNIEPETLWKTITVDIPTLRDFCAKAIG